MDHFLGLAERMQQAAEPVKDKTVRLYDAEKTAYEQQRKTWKEYQDNTRLTEQRRVDILKGLQDGEDLNTLFLYACEAIAAATHDPTFLDAVRKLRTE